MSARDEGAHRVLGEAEINVVDLGSGPPILFLHGVGCSARSWDRQLEAFKSTHRVVAMDMRGHGRSAPATESMTLDDYAKDVLAVMEELGFEHAVIVGASMGGMIAEHVAVLAPHRVQKLVLSGTSARTDKDNVGEMKNVAGAVSTVGMAGLVKELVHVTYSATAISERRPYIAAFEEAFVATDPYSFMVAMQAIADLDVLQRIQGLKVKTLVVIGSEEQLLPLRHSEAIVSAIPGSRLVVIDGAGHLCHEDEPDTFNRHLLAFLAD